jgi:hypothetical protein
MATAAEQIEDEGDDEYEDDAARPVADRSGASALPKDPLLNPCRVERTGLLRAWDYEISNSWKFRN